jgi:serine/threonine protein kinase/Flp pilus assembly protein TadD
MSVDADKVKSLFFDALVLPDPAARAAFLDKECAGDAELRRRVEALVNAHERPGDFLERAATIDSNDPAPAVPETVRFTPPPAETAGMRIGQYKLLQRIGEGGMGAVWMAEQTEPVRRQVALKVIKAGMDSAQVIARFEAERQALALMDHPNIAKVLDAGGTETGRPYFVMELVKGIPITKYCDERRLGPRERLELFVPVCQAVQHAHQKGIIHRDLKPSNVLVALYDGRPVPKVIDFGVAKAVSQKLTEKTMFTAFGALVGTLEYMSPEQAELNQLDIDTRSDVYALGVLLYELLTGSTPLDRRRLREGAFLDILRRIREEEPPRPSTRISSSEQLANVAAQRGTEPTKLTRLVKGDLDWIVMKCLEKDRNRRYETANGLASDIQRHLADEPVLAGPPTARYRMRKFVRRNRAAVLVALTLALLLVGGVTGTTLGLIAARRDAERARQAELLAEMRRAEADEERHQAEMEKRRADDEAAIAREINDFVQTDLLAQASPYAQKGPDQPSDPDVKLRTVLDRAGDRIEGRFKDKPLVEAGLRNTIGGTYLELGDYRRAGPHLRKALALHEAQLGPDHPDTLTSRFGVAKLLAFQGKYKEAEAEFRLLYEKRRAVRGEGHPETIEAMNMLALVLVELVRYDEAEKLYLQARALLERGGKEAAGDPTQPLMVAHNLALLYWNWGRYDQARELFELARAGLTARLGPEHPDALMVLQNIALLDIMCGEYDSAERRLAIVLEGRKKRLGDDHPDTLVAMCSLGQAHQARGRFDRAAPLMVEALRRSRETRGDDHPGTLQLTNNLGLLRQEQGQLDEAERLLAPALKRASAKLGDDHWTTLSLTNNLALVYRDRGRFPEAKVMYEDALRRVSGRFGEDHPRALLVRNNLGRLLQLQGDLVNAEKVFRAVLEKRSRILGDVHPDTLNTMCVLAQMACNRGELETAAPLCEKALERSRKKLGKDHPQTLFLLATLAEVRHQQGRLDEAERILLDAVEMCRTRLGERHLNTLDLLCNLAVIYLDQAKLDKVEPLVTEARDGLRGQVDDTHPLVLRVCLVLGSLYLDQGRLEEAERLLTTTLATSRKALGEDHPMTLYLQARLGEVFRRRGNIERAEPLLLKSYERMKEIMGEDNPDTLTAMNNLTLVYQARKHFEQAEDLGEKLLALRVKKHGESSVLTLIATNNLALTYASLGKFDKAEPMFEQVREGVRGKIGPESGDFVTLIGNLLSVYLARNKLDKAEQMLAEVRKETADKLGKDHLNVSVMLAYSGMVYLKQNKFAESEAAARECLEIRENKAKGTWLVFSSKSLLGAALAGQMKYVEAEPLLLDGYEGMKQRAKDVPPVRLAEAGKRLVELYDAWGKKEKADEWRKKLAGPD